MYSIFESASFVTAWLGFPDDYTNAAMDAMNDVGRHFEAFSFCSVPELMDWIMVIKEKKEIAELQSHVFTNS